MLRSTAGEIRVEGRGLDRLTGPAKKAGIEMALIPEDRKTEGLLLPMSIADNLALASLARVSRGPFIDNAALEQAVDDGVGRMQIKVGSIDDPVSTLSGGNQQKVVIAKWLMTSPKVILLNDPTRGIDVGTKQEIYRLLRELAEAVAAILFYSTDYEELIGCCDRVAVMYDGQVVRELPARRSPSATSSPARSTSARPPRERARPEPHGDLRIRPSRTRPS